MYVNSRWVLPCLEFFPNCRQINYVLDDLNFPHETSFLMCCVLLWIPHDRVVTRTHTHSSHGREWRRRMAVNSKEKRRKFTCEHWKGWTRFSRFSLSGMLRSWEWGKVKKFRAFIFFMRFAPFILLHFCQPSARDERREWERENVICVCLRRHISSAPIVPIIILRLMFRVSVDLCFSSSAIMYSSDGRMASSLISRAVISDANMKRKAAIFWYLNLPSPAHISPSFHHDDNHKSFTRSPKNEAYTVHVKMKMRQRTLLVGIRAKPKQVSFIPAQHNKEGKLLSHHYDYYHQHRRHHRIHSHTNQNILRLNTLIPFSLYCVCTAATWMNF